MAAKIWNRRQLVDEFFLYDFSYKKRDQITREWKGHTLKQMEEAFSAGFIFPSDLH